MLGPVQKLTHLDPKERHRLEREALARRHGREKLDIERRKCGLARAEEREQRLLDERLGLAADKAQAVRHQAEQQFYDAARNQGLWRKRDPEDYELSEKFSDAAEFVEEADRSGGGDDEERALSWKDRAERNARRHRRPPYQSRPRRGRGYGRDE